MKAKGIKLLTGAALIGISVTVSAAAQAYWGGPWGDPWSEPGWGGGPGSEPGYSFGSFGPMDLNRTHQRQSQMRDHKAAMQSVARMLSGRRSFDRAEAISVAREIEASAGENLVRLFESADHRRSPISRARVGEGVEAFQARAAALKVAAGALADALEKQPTVEDMRAGRAWSPDWRRSTRGLGAGGPYGRWRNESGALTKEVFDAFYKLQDTCHGCHANFRSPWR
jgi:cytochrome c556